MLRRGVTTLANVFNQHFVNVGNIPARFIQNVDVTLTLKAIWDNLKDGDSAEPVAGALLGSLQPKNMTLLSVSTER